jgi:HTH-type transcriptional regulator/antitoxin HigA
MRHFMPAEIFPPGEYLKDALEAHGWSQTEFAEIIGRPTRVVNEIIAAKRSISPETAHELAAALDTSAQYWLNLESAYQLSRVPRADERIAREAALRRRFPVREMMKRGWIPQSDNFDEVERRTYEFFGVKAANDNIVFAHAARSAAPEDDRTELQWAWILRVSQLAEALQVPAYSEKRLRSALSDLEALLLEPEGVRQIPRILAECGVRFIVVEPIPGSEIHGVCFWLNKGTSPVIGLTLKWDFIDRFWFNLRHEIEHVLNGDGKDCVLTDEFEEPTGDEDQCEIVANREAAEFCVPQAKLDDFIARNHPLYYEKNFIGFCRIIQRHPGIVAGQLQRKINDPRLFKKHQARVREVLIGAAITDGYGRQVSMED